MVLASHADTEFHNESKGRSQAGSHIITTSPGSQLRWNGPVLIIAQIIKFFITSVAEAHLGALLSLLRELSHFNILYLKWVCHNHPPW